MSLHSAGRPSCRNRSLKSRIAAPVLIWKEIFMTVTTVSEACLLFWVWIVPVERLNCIFFLSFFHFIVVQVQLSPFSPTHDPLCTHPSLPPSNLPSLALSICPVFMFLDGPSPIIPCYPSPPSSQFLSVCSLIQCLWFYFACLFALLIRFHL